MNEKFWRPKYGVVLALVLSLAALMLLFTVAAPSRAIQAAAEPPLSASEKLVDLEQVPAGGTVTYDIVLRNTSVSTTVLETVVVDRLSQYLSCDEFAVWISPPGTIAGWVCGPSADVITFTVSQDMTPGKVITLTFEATLADVGVNPGDVITNMATIDDGTNLIETNVVSFTVGEPPTVQISQPLNGALITEKAGEVYTVSGLAWNSTNAPGFLADPVLEEILYVGDGSAYYVSWGAVDGALNYTIQEATDPYFETITHQNTNVTATSNPKYYIEGRAAGTYYYRVRAHNLAGVSRWSNVLMALVGASQAADGFHVETLAADAPVVEVSINGGVWQTATVGTATGGWWTWSFDWTLPQEDEAHYTIAARAQDAGGNYGESDVITVTIRNGIQNVYLPLIARRWPPVPLAPNLFEISNADEDGDYTVSWAYTERSGVPTPTGYRLEESTSAAFPSDDTTVYTTGGSTFSYSFTDKPAGTYYYRVQGVNSYGNGEWSLTRSVYVSSRDYYDDFTDSNSGWPRQIFKPRDCVSRPDVQYYCEVLDAAYDNNTYRMKVLLNELGFNNRRMGVLPAPYTPPGNNYDVEVQQYFRRAVDQLAEPAAGKAGIVFRAERVDGYFRRFFAIEWNFEGQCAISEYDNTPGQMGQDPYVPVAWLPRPTIWVNWQSCPGLRAGYDQTNTVRAEVRGNQVTFYINEQKLGTYSGFGGDPHVGLISGAWDRTPVQNHFNYIRVTDR